MNEPSRAEARRTMHKQCNVESSRRASESPTDTLYRATDTDTDTDDNLWNLDGLGKM